VDTLAGIGYRGGQNQEGAMRRVIFIVLILALPVNAHVGDRIFPIPEIPDEWIDELDVRDRSLDDWEDVGLYPVLTAMDFVSVPTAGEGAPYNPSDMDYRIWLGWNGSTSRLYFAMERIDDVFVNEYEGNLDGMSDYSRHDGSFEFMVDGDHSGGNYLGFTDPNMTEEEKILNRSRTAQLYMAITDTPDDKHIGYYGAGSQWVTQPPYARS